MPYSRSSMTGSILLDRNKNRSRTLDRNKTMTSTNKNNDNNNNHYLNYLNEVGTDYSRVEGDESSVVVVDDDDDDKMSRDVEFVGDVEQRPFRERNQTANVSLSMDHENSLYLDMSQDVPPPSSPLVEESSNLGTTNKDEKLAKNTAAPIVEEIENANTNVNASVVDLDSIDGTDGDSSSNENYVSYEEDGEDFAPQEGCKPEKESSKSTSYLSFGANGNVVQSFPLSSVQSSLQGQDDRSIHSIPRSALPERNLEAPVTSLLSDSHPSNEAENENGCILLLEPPDAMDYAPAEFMTTESNEIAPSHTDRTFKARKSSAKVDKKESSSFTHAKAFKKSSISESQRTSTRKEEESAAAAVVAAKEAPPPVQVPVYPPNNYSHLLAAYEFEKDPSIPPIPLPELAFVQSPTDERRIDDENKRSPNTSYEDDIEIGRSDDYANAVNANNESTKSRTRGPKSKLLSIFSPTENRATKDKNTPETDVGSPASGRNGITGGRQLFSDSSRSPRSPRSPYDDGYDGESDVSPLEDDGTTMTHKSKMRRAQRKRRCWIIGIVVFLTVVLLAAAGVIAYAMITKAKAIETNTESSIVIDIATETKAPNPQSDVIVPAQDDFLVDFGEVEDDLFFVEENETSSNATSEIIASLRPVTLKNPTNQPTALPTVAPKTESPTTTVAPSAGPTSGPTKNPTDSPTLAPIENHSFVARLQTLLQTKNFDNGQNENEVFQFDFSSSNPMEDPANQALVYLAREVIAVQNWVPPPPKENEESNRLGNVVVTVGSGTPPPTLDLNFVPIDILEDYSDEKLLQRFAMLALRFGANQPVAESEPIDDAPTEMVVSPAKRIVIPEEAVDKLTETAFEMAAASAAASASETQAPSSNTNDAETDETTDPPSASYSPVLSLADPNDPLFLVDECEWEGVHCTLITKNSTTNQTDATITKLRWDYRELNGTISSSIGLLTGLTSLDLSNNNLQGSVPESLYGLKDLMELYLFQNNLGGTLSTMVGNLDKLERLHISHNAFTGSLPKELKSDAGSVNGIRPLKYFNVYSNQFIGTIPSDLRWRRCVHFDVGRNQLTGTLPSDLGEKFGELRHLFLDHNQFSGTLPSSYNSVGNGRLVAMAIDHNRLTGEVPGQRELYDNLVQYTLHENRFTSLDQRNCQNHLLVEFKADCPNVCTCFGRFFEFCDRWCEYQAGPGENNRNPGRNPSLDSNPNVNWQQQQQQQQWNGRWERPPQQNWSF